MEKNILEKTKSLIGCPQGPITNHYQHLELQTRGNNMIQTESDMDITLITSVQIRQDILAMQCNAKLGVLLYFHSLPFVVGEGCQTFFYPTFFLLQLNPTYMNRILHFKNITFKSSYNWFKIDIHQQLRPLTANYLAMFKVTSTTIYT